ncbi:MAG TPA: hypothetical protein VGW74_13135 [Propionibacteriaceae bacterium]|nr:hypothetical protein [Propionibacteriaceae bacterium]
MSTAAYLSDDTGLPWLLGTDGQYRRPVDCALMLGEPEVALPLPYLEAEFGAHTVPDDGTDPWATEGGRS